jgi:HAD superfamily phosphoserine phosphatase-like hydrolase
MIAAFDLDGTLLNKNSSLVFCNYLCDKGLIKKRDLYFCFYIYLRHIYGSLPLLDLHGFIFKRLFQQQPSERLNMLVDSFLIEKLKELWYFPALFRLRRLQQKGFKCLILSNSPSFLVRPIAEKIGVDAVYSTEYKSDEMGRLTGIDLVMDGAKKAEIIAGIPSEKTMAFSDSHFDLSFLQTAHVAVAVNPKYRLKKIAIREGWEIL